MAEGKDTFILPCDMVSVVDLMPDEMAGQLLKTILHYVNDRNPEVEDFALKLAFEPIKTRLKKDLVKWRETCEKRSETGKLGGRPPKPENQNKPKKANGFSENQKKQEEPKKADNEGEGDNECVPPTEVGKTPAPNLDLVFLDKNKTTTPSRLVQHLETETAMQELCMAAGVHKPAWPALKNFALTKIAEFTVGGHFDNGKTTAGNMLLWITRDWKDPTKNIAASNPKTQRPTGQKITK